MTIFKEMSLPQMVIINAIVIGAFSTMLILNKFESSRIGDLTMKSGKLSAEYFKNDLYAKDALDIELEDLVRRNESGQKILNFVSGEGPNFINQKELDILSMSSQFTCRSPYDILLDFYNHWPSKTVLSKYPGEIKIINLLVKRLKLIEGVRQMLIEGKNKSRFKYLEDRGDIKELKEIRALQNKLKEKGLIIARNQSVEGIKRSKASHSKIAKLVLKKNQNNVHRRLH